MVSGGRWVVSGAWRVVSGAWRVVRVVRGEWGESRVRRGQLHHLALVEDVAAEEHPLAAHLARRVGHHLIEEGNVRCGVRSGECGVGCAGRGVQGEV